MRYPTPQGGSYTGHVNRVVMWARPFGFVCLPVIRLETTLSTYPIITSIVCVCWYVWREEMAHTKVDIARAISYRRDEARPWRWALVRVIWFR